MRFDEEHIRLLKKLWQQLKKEGGAGPAPMIDDPLDALMEGVFATYAAESRAHTAAYRLRTAMVDINELRVTPVAEMVEIVGSDYPMCRPAAEELVKSLSSLFNRTHKLDLTFLKKHSKKGAEAFLNRLDGLGAHAKAYVLMRCFKAHAIPVDYHMLAIMRKAGCVPAEAAVEDVQKFLLGHIKESEAAVFYALLKRHAAAHAPRKAMETVPVAAPEEPKTAPPTTPTMRNADDPTRQHPLAKIAEAKKAQPAKQPAAKGGPSPGSAGRKR